MKKKLIISTLLYVVSGLVYAGETLSTIVVFDNTSPAWATDTLGIYDAIPGTAVGGGGGNAKSATLSDGSVLDIDLTGGGGRIRANNSTTFVTTGWENTAAFEEMSVALGTTIRLSDIAVLKYVTAGQQDRRSTVSISNETGLLGKAVVFYLAISCGDVDQQTDSLTSITVSGLSNASVSYATATGNGFISTLNANETGYQKLTLVKITGTVTDTITFEEDVAKNGWAMAAWKVIPEPSTAALSLLALAGLAARRRRK